MGKPWEEGCDFFIRRSGGRPCAVMVDLEALRHAPLASHPWLYVVGVVMQQPMANGFRSGEEAPALFALEDRLVDALQPLGALYLGRRVEGGSTFLFFYAPEALARADVERVLAAERGAYDARILRCEDDPRWRAYLEDLYPDEVERQTILNRHVLTSLAENGDQHEVPRPLDHFALFASETDAAHAAAALVGRGFTVAPPHAPEDGKAEWGLSFMRIDALDGRRADEVTTEVVEVVGAFGGTYDGWGCQVQQQKKPGLLARLLKRG